MSRIKDLYAIVEGIEDLMPCENDVETYRWMRVDDLSLKAFKLFNKEDARLYIRKNIEVEDDYDEYGRHSLCLANLLDLCKDIADCIMEEYIEQECLDLDDKTYDATVARLAALVESEFDDDDILGEYIDDAREDAWAREDYNRMTLP